MLRPFLALCRGCFPLRLGIVVASSVVGFLLTQAGALPTTSTATMGLLGFGPPLVVYFCSSVARSALRSRTVKCSGPG